LTIWSIVVSLKSDENGSLSLGDTALKEHG